MQSSDEDISSVIAQWTPSRARFRRSNVHTRGSDQTTPQSPLQESTEDSESNSAQTAEDSESPNLADTFSRLQQIRSALSYLEESLNRADGIEGQASSGAPQNPISNAETSIGPPHSAILLSEGNNSPPPPFERLRERLDQIERSLPRYMFATNEFIQRRAQTQQGINQAPGTRSSANPSDSTTSAPRHEENTTTSPRNRTPDAVPEQREPVRPTRELNRNTEGGIGLHRPETRATQDTRPAHTLPAWRIAYRDDDSPSTMLGRRVAARAAARASGNSTSDPRRRAIPPASTLFWQGQTDPIVPVVPRRAAASRVVVPPRVPDRVSRRIAQFESASSERQRREESDGSETEVEHYVYRPPVIRRRLVERDGRPPNPLEFVTISPASSLGGGAFSTVASHSDPSSPQQAEGDRPPAVSSRMQNVYGHLNRLSNALSDAPSSTGPSSSSDGGDLDGALFSRTPGRRRERDDLYHEVVDEEVGRSYRILRRLNANGEEQVHQLNSDAWSDSIFMPNAFAAMYGQVAGSETERQLLSAAQASATTANNGTSTGNAPGAIPTSVERPRRPFTFVRQSQQSETDLPPLITDAPTVNTNMATRRRRGWARLDANGDEIPTDEEEEIDRVLTAQRIRSSQGAAWRTSTNTSSTSSTVRTRLEYLAPTTRSVFSHATDEEEDEENSADIRVRLGLSSALVPRRFTGPTPRFNVFSDAWKEREKEREREQEFFGTSEPYFVSPVPVCYEEMVPSARSSSESYDTGKGFGELREKAVAGI